MDSLSEFKILDMANQMRMAKFAYESIVAMFQDGIYAIPTWMDDEHLYWCVSHKPSISEELSHLHVVSTRFETKHAGQQVSMTTTITQNPRIEKNIRESIDRMLLSTSEDLGDRISKTLVSLGIKIPDNPYDWLTQFRRSMNK